MAVQSPPPPPGDQPDLDNPDIVVRGTPAYIIVHGRPHCRPLHDDPMDAVPVPLVHRQSVVAPNRETGVLEFRYDRDPITGPDQWYRAGTAIGAYVFRAPGNGTPLCIGAQVDNPGGFGQLRQVLDARPYRNRTIRFTAWVATSQAREVRFWLAAGDGRDIMLGDDTRETPLRGTNRWTPVSLTIGPVPRYATKVSYGFLLQGSGDVWLARPQLEVIEVPGVVDGPEAP
jgi:hypothetical protein